jgi:hypothetical protein
MGLTTDIYDDMDERNLRLATVDRANAARAESASQAAPPNPGGRSFGFRSGAAQVGGVADQRLNLATEAGKELGAPTSFNAGAGAPAPIGVIRGMRQTFATDAGGAQLSEFATPLQAQQAFNREGLREATGATKLLPEKERLAALSKATEQFGGYEPAQGPALRLLAERRPDLQTQANLVTEAGFQKTLNKRLLNKYGEVKEGSLVLPLAIQKLAMEYEPKSKEEVESILQQIKPEAEKSSFISLHNDLKNPVTIGLRNKVASLFPNDSKMQEFIKTAPIDKSNAEWFQKQFAIVTSPPQAPAGPAGPTPAITGRTVAPSPLRTEPLTGTMYNRFTGQVEEQPSLLRETGKAIFGTPEDWQKAYERDQEEQRSWEQRK